MPQILLINPNTNLQTSAMMVRLVQQQCPPDWQVHGITATEGVALITNPAELAVAAHQVRACWAQAAATRRWDGVVLACFADPALDWLRSTTGVPTVGIGEAAMRAASQGQRRFGIATTTPALDHAMQAQAQQLGLGHLYTGARYTAGPPLQLLAQAQIDALHQQLHSAVQHCVAQDGAQTVVIGGGPLGQAAQALATQTHTPLIAPLTAAAQWMQHALISSSPAGTP